jgi:predicted nucleotidyltransferase
MAAVRARFGANLFAVVLFGSVARNQANAESDVDLLVVATGLPGTRSGRSALSVTIRRQVAPEIDRVHQLTGWHPYLSTIYLTPAEASGFRRMYLDMLDDAILLFDGNGFFARVLDGVREQVGHWGAKRIPIGNTHYWQLIPHYAPGKKVEW